MNPTLASGDYLLVDRTAYSRGAPERGDIVLFHPPDDDDETYVKRIVGLPGETVTIRDDAVLIDGSPLTEPYLTGVKTRCPAPRVPAGCSWTVPAGAIFVLGDNRTGSSDSREFGPVPLARVVGEAVVTVWPPTEFSSLP
jgi:signal peptidase I